MDKAAVRATLPYVIGLAVAALLFYFARQIEFTPRPGSLGPQFWPKLAIGLMAAVCLFEIARGLLGLKGEAHGGADALERDETEEDPPVYPRLLAGGVVLVVAYALAVETLGFFLCTFLFLAAFMYLGRYRRHKAVWLTSAGVTLAAAVLFMRIAYVSLPRGVPPFDAVTDFVRIVLGG